jgi:hypothetical protein
MNVKENWGRGRSRNGWLYMIENDMRTIGVCVENVKNRDDGGLGQEWSTPNSWEQCEW